MTILRSLLTALLAFLALARVPAMLALDDGGDDDTDDGDGSDDDADDGDDDDGDGSDGDGEDDEPPKAFTQADLDEQINKRLARERRKHEREVAKLKKAGKGKDGKDPEPNPDAERATRAEQRALKTEAKAAALAAGVSKERVGRFLRMVELDADAMLDEDGEPDEDAIAAAVDEALEDVPEFRPAAKDDVAGKGKGGKSGADGMNGDGGKKKTWSRTEIAALTDEQYDKNRDSIEAAVREGRVTG